MKFIFLQGPTASGKSELALSWAEELGGVLINCDSIQVYQDLRIGSATPSSSDLLRAPHFLYSYIPAGGQITAGQYRRDFFDTIKSLQARSSPPNYVWVVGGTGFYFQALEKGLFPVGGAREELRRELLSAWSKPGGAQSLYQELLKKDPAQRGKISSNDQYRILRALEIMKSQDRPLSEIQAEFQERSFPYPLIKIGIKGSKDFFLDRVQTRTQRMLDQGLIEEVKDLLDRGFADWPALQSVGYKETLSMLLRDSPPITSQLKKEILQGTMKLIKKQRTWFQRDPEIHWLDWDRYPSFQNMIEAGKLLIR